MINGVLENIIKNSPTTDINLINTINVLKFFFFIMINGLKIIISLPYPPWRSGSLTQTGY